MFVLYAKKNQLIVRKRGTVTSGSVKVYTVRFEFSSDWGGMERVAVFRAGPESRSVLLDETNTCDVPWEVLAEPNIQLQVGVYGTRGGEEVLPTIWADLGAILSGVTVGQDAKPPTPDLWQQELDRKQDKLHGLPGQVVGFNEDGEAVAQDVAGEGGGGGISYTFGHGLKVNGTTVSVDAVSDFSGDNTLPMTAAGVQTTVGNIEALLGTI